MYKVAVVGDYDSIYGLRRWDWRHFRCRCKWNGESSGTLASRFLCGDLYITEAAAAGIETAIDRYREQPLPSVI